MHGAQNNALSGHRGGCTRVPDSAISPQSAGGQARIAMQRPASACSIGVARPSAMCVKVGELPLLSDVIRPGSVYRRWLRIDDPPRAGQHPATSTRQRARYPPALGKPVGAAPRPDVMVSLPATAGASIGRDPPSPDRRVQRRGACRRDGVRDAGGDATAMTPTDVDDIVRNQATGRSPGPTHTPGRFAAAEHKTGPIPARLTATAPDRR
jgi:hypothetical protein